MFQADNSLGFCLTIQKGRFILFIASLRIHCGNGIDKTAPEKNLNLDKCFTNLAAGPDCKTISSPFKAGGYPSGAHLGQGSPARPVGAALWWRSPSLHVSVLLQGCLSATATCSWVAGGGVLRGPRDTHVRPVRSDLRALRVLSTEGQRCFYL